MPRDLREKLNDSRISHFQDLDLRKPHHHHPDDRKNKKKKKKSKDKKERRHRRRRDRSPSMSSSSSLSLSPGPPMRVDKPLSALPRRRVSRSPPHSVTQAKQRRIGSLPKRRASRSPNRKTKSWDDKVNDYLASLNVVTPSQYRDTPPPSNPPSIVPQSSCNEAPPPTLLPPGVDSESPEYESTPLIRFIGRKLRLLKLEPEDDEGIFTYNVLSLLSRSEWIAAKTLSLLQEAGFGQSELYEIAVTSPTQFEMELKTAVFTGKVKLDGKPKAIQKVLRVIECIKEYFTSKGEEEEKSEASDGSEDPLANKNALGPFLKQLSASLKKENEAEITDKPSNEPPKEKPNPWTRMSDAIQSQNFASFRDIQNTIAKDLLRLHGRNVNAFDLAQEMVSCWVIAGFGLESLKHLVMKTSNDQILPQSQLPGKKCLSNQLFQRLLRHKNEFSPVITEDNLKYLIKKSLLYIMKGCNRYYNHTPMPTARTPNNEHVNIIFNYLPPGLREAESSSSSQSHVDPYVDEKSEKRDEAQTTLKSPPKKLEEVLSTDPLNAVLNPVQETLKPNQLPNRKYNLVTLHCEWVILKGIPQIYEISAYSSSDMTVLNLYSVTPSLKKSPDTLENLGFVSNPDRHEFYYVQVGIGCVKALNIDYAMNKLASFLEEKRNCSDSENRNNGLILMTHSSEELGNFLNILSETGHNNLLIDVIKGFGCLETFIDRNKSKKYSYGGPKLSLSGGEEVFYESEVRKGITAHNLVSKSKSEALYLAIQYLLDNSYPNFSNFISPYCISSFSPVAEDIKKKVEKVRELYTLEVFLSAHLKAQKIPLFLEGVFAPLPIRDLRDKASVIANRVVSLLVQAGYDKKNLSDSYAKDKDFAINSNVFLNTMNMSNRLKVMDQTMRCIHIIKDFYLQ